MGNTKFNVMVTWTDPCTYSYRIRTYFHLFSSCRKYQWEPRQYELEMTTLSPISQIQVGPCAAYGAAPAEHTIVSIESDVEHEYEIIPGEWAYELSGSNELQDEDRHHMSDSESSDEYYNTLPQTPTDAMDGNGDQN